MDSWAAVPELFRSGAVPLPAPWEAVFGPLRAGKADEMVVVGQLGQSLDGRVAAPTGHSHYINGPAGLAHLHRLRALVDAVVIGIGTALADDPQLTVRRVSGPHPVRVVIDPSGRLPASARLLANDGVRRIVLSGSGVRPPLPQGIEIVGLPNVRRPDRSVGNPCGPGRARPAPYPHRRRRGHRFAVPGCRLPRPVAFDRRPDRARLRARRSRAAADRTCRSGAACSHARAQTGR